MTSTSIRWFVGSMLAVTLAGCGTSRRAAGDAGVASDAADAVSDGTIVTRDASSDGEVAGAIDAGCACRSSASTGCIDLRVDDDNCGACGHGCPTETTCNGGVCGPAPRIIQPARTSACDGLDLAVAGTTLLWADQASGQLLRASPTAPIVIASGEDRPRAVAVGGDEVFWLAGVAPRDGAAPQILPGAAIRAASLAGSVSRTVVMPPAGVDAFTVSADGLTVYYSTSTRIEKASATTPGSPVVVVSKMDQGDTPVGLALDGSTLAFIGEYGGDVDAAMLVDGQVSNCPPVQLYDAATTVLCTGVGRDINGRSLVVAAGVPYYHDGDAIKRASLTARGMQVVIAYAEEPLTDIALSASGNALLLSGFGDSMPSGGEILELPLADPQPSTPLRLARAQNAPASVAADGALVYWSTADCAVKSVPLK